MFPRLSLARAGEVLGVLGLCVALVVGCQSSPKNAVEPAQSPKTAQKAPPTAKDEAKGSDTTADKPAEPSAQADEKKVNEKKADKPEEPKVAADREATRKAIAERIRARAQAAAKARLGRNRGDTPAQRSATRRINEAGVTTGARPAPSRSDIEGNVVAKRQAVDAHPEAPAVGATPSNTVSPAVAGTPVKPTERKPAKPGKKSAGCGAKGKGQLTMYPEGGPQPKYVVKQQKVELNNVWMGQKAQFVFEVANEGDVPLEIQLKGG